MYSAKVDAFSAVKSAGSAGFVMFDKVFTSPNSSFNLNDSSLNTYKTGLYWINVAINVPPSVDCASYLSPLTAMNNVALKKSRLNNTDTMNRNGVIRVQANNSIKLMSQYRFEGAYWAGFRLDTIMNPLLCFYVAKSSNISSLGLITGFDQIIVNEGSGWNSTSSAFIAPSNGTYFFSFSGGLLRGQLAIPNLCINDIPMMYSSNGIISQMTSGKS